MRSHPSRALVTPSTGTIASVVAIVGIAVAWLPRAAGPDGTLARNVAIAIPALLLGNMLVAIFMGCYLAKPLVPAALSLTDDVIPELLSETVRTTFDSDRRLTTEQTEAVARMFTEYVERDQAIVDSLYQEGIGKT